MIHKVSVGDGIICDDYKFVVVEANDVITVSTTNFCEAGDFIITSLTTTEKSAVVNVTPAPTVVTHRYVITPVPAMFEQYSSATELTGKAYMFYDIDTQTYFNGLAYANSMTYADLTLLLGCSNIQNKGKFADLNLIKVLQ